MRRTTILRVSALALTGAVMGVIGLSQSVGAQNSERSGKEVVQQVCAACHETGAKGAPKIGDEKAWSARAAQGLSALTRHAIQGIRQMPAHGGQPDLTDLELARAITYMVNASGGHWVAPTTSSELMSERSGEEVVKAVCSHCHQEGKDGAPRIGDTRAWALRLQNGLPYAVRSAIHGHGGMPPRGGQANLTDDEIRNAILYMFNPKPNAPASSSSESAESGTQAESMLAGLDRATAGGVDVYLGVMSADKLRAYPQGSPERTMHGGVPSGKDWYHLNVSLVRESDHAPVTGAQVDATVQELGLSAQSKRLEPMLIGQGSYGNYFRMRPETRYRITVHVRTAEGATPIEVEFQRENE
ncbi:MAG: c-type cytochrome [Arenicellales bacterium]|jgi:cytochrome c5